MAVSADWQIELDTGGSAELLTGPGTEYILTRGGGFRSFPGIRSGDVTRSNNDGSFPGTDYLANRDFVIEWRITGDSAAALEASIEALRAAMRPARDEWVMTWQTPGQGTRRANVRARALNVNQAYQQQAGLFTTASCRLTATDPLLVSGTLQSQLVQLETASTSGITLPAALPWVMPAAEAGTVAATNGGTYPGHWVGTVTGPVTNPRITHVENGQHLEILLTLAASTDFVVFDSKAMSILLQGTASRYSTLSAASQWFTLAPGTNTIRFSAGSGTGTLLWEWRDTYV